MWLLLKTTQGAQLKLCSQEHITSIDIPRAHITLWWHCQDHKCSLCPNWSLAALGLTRNTCCWVGGGLRKTGLPIKVIPLVCIEPSGHILKYSNVCFRNVVLSNPGHPLSKLLRHAVFAIWWSHICQSGAKKWFSGQKLERFSLCAAQETAWMFAGITAGSDRGVWRMRKYKGIDVQHSKASM